MTSSESPTHPDAPRAGGETPMIDPKRIAADAVQRLADSEPDEDAIAAMDRLAGTPQESMFCVSAPVLERVIEVAVADALFDASRVSLLERHRDGERHLAHCPAHALNATCICGPSPERASK